MLPAAEFTAPAGTRPVWAVAAVIHIASAAAAFMLALRAPGLMPLVAWCGLEGAGAAVLGALAGLPVWWLLINLLFAPVAYALLGWQIPAPVYLAAFIVLFAVNAGAWRHRVPLFLSSSRVTVLLAGLLPHRAEFRFLDLGCGTGSLLAGLEERRPDGRYDGIEIAPLSYALSRLRLRGRRAARVTWGDFWRADFSRYDVVYAYLSPAPMARLWHKARREMRPGSLFVSNTFAIPGAVPLYSLPAGDRMRSTLHVWRM